MISGKPLRLRRFFRYPRTVIVPMDHPMFGGPVVGLEDPLKLVRIIAGTEADGVLTSPWVLARAESSLGQLATVARLDGGNTALGQRIDQTNAVMSVEQALNMGAEMIAVNIFVGGENEAEMLMKLGHVAEDCARCGIPLMGEMIPASALAHHYGRSQSRSYDASLGDPVAIAARIGAEFGSDIIKTVYSGDKASLLRTISTATVPVVIAGGPKAGSDAEFLSMVKDCLDAGSAGICMGRNVWQRERPEGMIAALCALAHDNASVEEAVRLL
ncbi:MAG: class I fructose-bisphosphate aldolase [Anaerolineae bacterium]